MAIKMILRSIIIVLLLAGTARASIFIDNGDGTVYDAETGLTWQNNDDGGVENLGPSSARDYCNQLMLGGYDDWRLPTVVELSNIVDYGRFNPAIAPNSLLKLKPVSYWTGQGYVNSMIPEYDSWFVDFKSGRVNFNYGGIGFRTICVRTIN